MATIYVPILLGLLAAVLAVRATDLISDGQMLWAVALFAVGIVCAIVIGKRKEIASETASEDDRLKRERDADAEKRRREWEADEREAAARRVVCADCGDTVDEDDCQRWPRAGGHEWRHAANKFCKGRIP